MRTVGADEAVAGIRSGEQVFVQGGAATPTPLLDALVRRAGELRDVGVIHFHTEGPAPHLEPAMVPHFRHRALFVGPNARRAIEEDRADYVPVFLSDVPRLFTSGAMPLDAVLVNATPPDSHGFCSLGTSVEAIHAALRSTRGAAVGVAAIDLGTRTVSFAGLGNIAAVLVGAGVIRRLVSQNGTAGQAARRIDEFQYPWPDRGMLVMHSDGLGTPRDLDVFPGLGERHPVLVAGVLYRELARGHDDVSVVVAREMSS